jgi:hypothetical protein
MKRFLILTASALLAGCGGVACEHPASDAATTKVDERLIGFWQVDRKASGVEGDADKDDEGLFVVGRQPGDDGSLAMATVSLKKGELEIERSLLRATTIEAKAYASVHSPPPGDEKPGAWWVVRYEVPEPGTLRVLSMNEDEVAKDVRGGKVPGTVQEPKPGSHDAKMVTLSATVEALRAYLGSRGDAVYRMDRPLVLKRLSLR